MFYYKNKLKAIGVIVAVVLLLAVAVSFCLWDDTSIKSLSAEVNTADFTGELPSPASDLALGARLEIDGISYTVGHKDASMITVYSDNVKSKGVTLAYDSSGNGYNYTGSEIFASINTYYDTVKDKAITASGKIYGKVSEYVEGHKDYSWNLWLPSVREMNLSHGSALLQGSTQPVMEWYETDARRIESANNWYWLRSPYLNLASFSFYVHTSGILGDNVVHSTAGAVRVALNLKI